MSMPMPMPMPRDLMPSDDEAAMGPAYIIYRDIPPGVPFDPTSPPVFWPPKDSDELFDALRAKYPHLSSHADRMRDAIIEFLIEERNSEHPFTTPTVTSTATPSTWPSISSVSTPSFNNSPELFNLATPKSFGETLQPQMPQSSKRMTGLSSAQQSPPSLDDMTTVFSLSASDQPKQRIRRKMTEAEKVEYRNRRIVKACDKCAKRKRKCNHSQTTGQTSSALPNGGYKVSKAPGTTPQRGPVIARPSQAPSSSSSSSDMTSLTNMLDWSPLGNTNVDFEIESMLAEQSTENPLHFDYFDYLDYSPASWTEGWSHGLATAELSPDWQAQRQSTPQDFALFDSSHLEFVEREIAGVMKPALLHVPDRDETGNMLQPGFELDFGSSNGGRASQRGMSDLALVRSRHMTRSRADLGHDTRASDEQNEFSGHLEKPMPTHTAHVHDAQGSAVDRVASDNGMLSGGLQTPSKHSTSVKKSKTFSTDSDTMSILSTPPQNTTDHAANAGLALWHMHKPGRLPTSPRPMQEESSEVPSTRALTLGEGVTGDRDPSTEMYMLRRRIPKALHSIVDRNNVADLEYSATLQTIARSRDSRISVGHQDSGCRQIAANQANGGAYLRLDGSTTQTVTSGLSADARVSTTDVPVHTRPHTVTSSSFCNDADVAGQIVLATSSSRTSAAASARSPSSFAIKRLSDHVCYRDHHGRIPQEDRLCDYFYVKDHNGRRAPVANSWVDAILLAAMICLLAALLLIADLHPSMLVLAFVCPITCTSGKYPSKTFRTEASIWPNIMRCSIENSAWLSEAYDQDLMDAHEAMSSNCRRRNHRSDPARVK